MAVQKHKYKAYAPKTTKTLEFGFSKYNNKGDRARLIKQNYNN